ncbi:hypothetical protein TRIUR3_13728 [Triticum urartu]|uniref:Uncharacterized protein n=1 Tax=Triticum urartu TaxID=4572 RepID=M7Z8C9_TRIUA|nr:hypothetical protein TRIUR3_13728 [Triticum urartu]
MDDFTFPTTAAAAEHAEPLFLHHHHRLLPFPHFASSPLWFPGDGVAVAPVVAVVSRRTADGMEEQEPTSSDSAAGRRSKGERGGEADEEGAVVRATGADGEDKMDKLWENFNEELEALRRAGSCPKKTAAAKSRPVEILLYPLVTAQEMCPVMNHDLVVNYTRRV